MARNAICITDADLDAPGPRIVYVNASFERMTGYAADEVLGRNPRFLQGPATDRRVLDRLRADLEAGRPFQGETVNYRKDGTPFTMAWRIAAVRGDDGRPTHYVAAQDDLTELRSAEQSVRSLADQLQRRLLPDLGDFGPIEVAWRYRPVAGHAQIGGDWYDAVARPDGSVVLIIGDLTGHDDEAASLVGEYRFTCRGLIRAFDEPGRILDELEAAILADHRPGRAMATMVVAVVGPHGQVRYSAAGHPAPLVRRASGGTVALDQARSPLLAASAAVRSRPTATAQLDPGDVLVAFSDGAFESRRDDHDTAYQHLADRLAAADATLTDQCVAAISTSGPDGAGPEPEDDIVALAVRISPRT